MSSDRDALVAFHEAGHAAAYLHHNMPFAAITMRSHTSRPVGVAYLRRAWGTDRAIRAVATLTGVISELTFSDARTHEMARQTHEDAGTGIEGTPYGPAPVVMAQFREYRALGEFPAEMALARRLTGGRDWGLADAWESAQELVDDHWTCIQMMAGALLKQRRLTRRGCLRIARTMPLAN